MADERLVTVQVEPLTAEAFRPFGSLVAAGAGPADFAGSASESWLLPPFEADAGFQMMFSRHRFQPMRFSRMERHFAVTQGFVPLGGTPFVMVVAPPTSDDPADVPAPERVRAFLADGSAGIVLARGTWHTLDRFPVRPPHVDLAFLTDRETQAELMRAKAAGGEVRLTQFVDYRRLSGVSFEVVGA